MVLSNADKAIHGAKALRSLRHILRRYHYLGYLEKITEKFTIARPGYPVKQFYAAFLIEFEDGTKWALYSTTSMRSDRIKEQQWDALNLKEIDPSIKCAYLVFPDGVSDKEKNNFIRKNNIFVSRKEYSKIDGIVSQTEICNKIENYAKGNKLIGQVKDLQGKNFEKMTADILSYAQNIEKWKFGDVTIEGMHYDKFEKIISCFGLDRSLTESISATCNRKQIGNLPSGGSPKTDVLVRVRYNDGTSSVYTISCKRSSMKDVSVHQYTADAFTDVLDCHNDRLRYLLNLFQEKGNMKDFGKDNVSELGRELEPYVNKLCRWVLGGYGGSGNEAQCAGFILTYDNNDDSISIDDTESYCKRLINNCRGNFGTPFRWTYASKAKGKSIQLKCRILK